MEERYSSWISNTIFVVQLFHIWLRQCEYRNNQQDEHFTTPVYSSRKIKKALALCTVIVTLILIINMKTSNVIMYVTYTTKKYYSLKIGKRSTGPVPTMRYCTGRVLPGNLYGCRFFPVLDTDWSQSFPGTMKSVRNTTSTIRCDFRSDPKLERQGIRPKETGKFSVSGWVSEWTWWRKKCRWRDLIGDWVFVFIEGDNIRLRFHGQIEVALRSTDEQLF